MRRFWVLIHRWLGLAMTIFLVIVGLTGSLLAFLPELERLTAPGLYAVRPDAARLDFATLAELAESRVPHGRVDSIYLGEPGRVEVWMSPRKNPLTGLDFELGFNQVFLDPASGEELGRRTWGDISEGLINLMPFIYKLHFELALGMTGIWILGICALIWTLDCFIGLYLTLPARRRKTPGQPKAIEQSWWPRWLPAWKIRWMRGSYRLNFDLHRAGGLWLWVVLLGFAWSSVYMNLGDTAYIWVMQAVSRYETQWTELADREKPLEQPRLDWRAAQSAGEQLMQFEARQRGFTVKYPVALILNQDKGVYEYRVRSSLDFQDKRGMTQLFFDADTGRLKLLLLPSGQFGGNTVTNWLYTLHVANVFGLPWRIVVSVLGAMIVMLSVTGVVIWSRKRRARLIASKRMSHGSRDAFHAQ